MQCLAAASRTGPVLPEPLGVCPPKGPGATHAVDSCDSPSSARLPPGTFMDRKDRREAWLRAFPAFREYLNQCVVCQETGYDPEKLTRKRGFGFQKNAREFFKPLTVNELGVCSSCSELGYPRKAPVDQ